MEHSARGDSLKLPTASWEEPEFESINMSAEIGGYYDDFAGESPAKLTGAEQPRGRDQ